MLRYHQPLNNSEAHAARASDLDLRYSIALSPLIDRTEYAHPNGHRIWSVGH